MSAGEHVGTDLALADLCHFWHNPGFDGDAVEENHRPVLYDACGRTTSSRLAARATKGRTAKHRTSHSKGRVRLADWNALLSLGRAWLVGGKSRFDRRTYRAGHLLDHGAGNDPATR